MSGVHSFIWEDRFTVNVDHKLARESMTCKSSRVDRWQLPIKTAAYSSKFPSKG